MNALESLAITTLRRWAWERGKLSRGPIAHTVPLMPGRLSHTTRATLREAALIRCIDFERAFAQLPEIDQALLVSRYVEGLPDHATARILGHSPRWVSYRLGAARALLAAVLDKLDLLS